MERARTYVLAGAAFAALFVIGYRAFIAPPPDFPDAATIEIAQGVSAPRAAELLADARVIRRSSALLFLLRAAGVSDRVQAGMYLFDAPQNAVTVAIRLAKGEYGYAPVRLTFTEGTSVREIAADLAEALPIAKDDFLAEARPYEGYLFPDTYLFVPGADAASIVKAMRANFNRKTETLTASIAASGRTISDVVVLASLVEKEARTPENKRIVAGILWNRLDRGMPLQVDAVFGYIFGRETYSPSFDDLKVDSLYNTYTHTGLPPGPINNPGLDSLDAATHPTKTDYLYYLTGNDNRMHYATTYAGHQANIEKYLRTFDK